ncbi:very short patch repair endonuclease [Stratiformator vulcanicus]|uniref:very short patch repair endonuclease n=1 Tax=Stratiformator vulcanicus TaxID=2527980 RepID=UPI0035C6D796
MSQNRGKNTSIELAVRSHLHRRGMRFRKNVKALPGCPDIVFSRAKLAIFLDGDFWHGYRFPSWHHKLSKPWREKIEETRKRDRRIHRRLRRHGWCVARFWEHEIRSDLTAVVDEISRLLKSSQ